MFDAWKDRSVWRYKLTEQQRVFLMDVLDADYPEIERRDLSEGVTGEERKHFKKYNRYAFIWRGGAT